MIYLPSPMAFPLPSFLLAHSVPVTNTPNFLPPQDFCMAVSSKRRSLWAPSSFLPINQVSAQISLQRGLSSPPNYPAVLPRHLLSAPRGTAFPAGSQETLLSAPALYSAAFKVAGASRGSCADTAAPPSQPQLLWLPGRPLADLPAQRGASSRPEDELNKYGRS